MEDKKIKVGVSILAPFVMKDGLRYSGFEIDLWKEISSRLNLKFDYIRTSFDNLIKNLKQRKYDVVFSGITINNERDKYLDFCTSYLDSELLIVTRKKAK